MKDKKNLKKLFIIILMPAIMLVNVRDVYAAGNISNSNSKSNQKDSNSSDVIFKADDMSNSFKKWLELPEEERNNTIQPSTISITLKDSVKRSKYNALISAGASASLESKFDLRNSIKSINVKNQEKTGGCWAFSYTTVMETTLAKRYNKYFEYSPFYIDYQSTKIFNKNLGGGGNPFLATAVVADRLSPVLESDFPMSSVYDEKNNSASTDYLTDVSKVNLNKNVVAKLKDSVIFTEILKNYNNGTVKYTDSKGNEYSIDTVNAIRSQIKEHVKTYGGVESYMYSDIKLDTATNKGVSDHYNSQTNSYYFPTPDDSSTELPNHAVTIIGWDDNYSKDNFKIKPSHDGAYLVLSSWGDQFGDKGAFYVSYDDYFIEYQMAGIKDIVDTSTEKNENTNSYIYDPLGMSYYITPGDSNNFYVANVFTRQKKNGYNEYLKEVGLYIADTSGIKIYYSDSGNLDNWQLVADYTGSNALETGYHLIDLSNKVKVSNDKFAVMAEYISKENVVIPIETNLKESGITDKSNFFDTATSNSGESFYSTDGSTWGDLTDAKVTDSSSNKKYPLKDSNVCIRAFTENVETSKDNNNNSNNNNTNNTNTNDSNNEVNMVIGIGDTTNTNNNGSNNNSNNSNNSNNYNVKNDPADNIYTTNDEKIQVIKMTTSNTTSTSDTTTATTKFPYAGLSVAIIVGILMISLGGIIIFIKYRSYKDIK